jgi:predicted ATP-binding protein involved in virulence
LPKNSHGTRGIFELFNYFKIEPSEKNISSLFNSIISEWSNCYGIDLLQINTQNKDRKDALNYLFYKTLKIIKNYDDFHQYEDNIKNNININSLIRALFKEKSHITTKVRRTIAFLIFNHYGTSGQCPKSNPSETSKYEVSIDDFSINMEEKLNKQAEIITELRQVSPSKKTYNINYTWKKDDMLPSPFLNTTLYLKHTNGDKTTFDSLSSGEKQIVYSLSTILYHLKNIDSVWDVDNNSEKEEGVRVKYRYINLMLDEIELYFHPLYQKKYINYLLKSLSNLDLQNIKGLNLILSTHSPFILSDLPDSNILYIENGKMKKDQLRMPFGANIYDILNQSFFMDSFVGEFSVEKMQSILKNIESSTAMTKEEYEGYNNIINIIGDTLIRNKMQLFLDEHFYKDKKQRKQREVERLQKQIDKIKESM